MTEQEWIEVFTKGKRSGFIIGMNTAAAFLITLWAIHQLFV
jgi:hypothetical protein